MKSTDTRKDFAHVIAERTLHLTNEPELVEAVAAYLIEANEPYDLNSVMRDIVAYRAHQGYVEANVYSAHPIEGQVHKNITDIIRGYYPKAKRITINQKLEPALIGGFRLEMPGKEIDYSVRARLNTLKQLVIERSF